MLQKTILAVMCLLFSAYASSAIDDPVILNGITFNSIKWHMQGKMYPVIDDISYTVNKSSNEKVCLAEKSCLFQLSFQYLNAQPQFSYILGAQSESNGSDITVGELTAAIDSLIGKTPDGFYAVGNNSTDGYRVGLWVGSALENGGYGEGKILPGSYPSGAVTVCDSTVRSFTIDHGSLLPKEVDANSASTHIDISCTAKATVDVSLMNYNSATGLQLKGPESSISSIITIDGQPADKNIEYLISDVQTLNIKSVLKTSSQSLQPGDYSASAILLIKYQ